MSVTGIADTGLIENLGHADFLSNQPFKHLDFLLVFIIDETVSLGWAASSLGGAVRWLAATSVDF